MIDANHFARFCSESSRSTPRVHRARISEAR